MRRLSWSVLAFIAALCALGTRVYAGGPILIDGANISAGAGALLGRTIVDQYSSSASWPVIAPRLRPPKIPAAVSDIPSLPALVEGHGDYVLPAGTSAVLA